LGWGRVEPDGHAGPGTWFAIWEPPDGAASRSFLSEVAGSGWYDYFEQTNVVGKLIWIPEAVDQHLAL